jgi:hypothetical protein
MTSIPASPEEHIALQQEWMASHAEVFGEGSHNSRCIDYIAAAMLRVAETRGAQTSALATPHRWAGKPADLSGISP